MGYRIIDEMSRLPAVVAEDSTVGDAISLMKHFHIRHLPVMKRKKLIGVVSERDLRDRNVSLRQKISDIMIQNPYKVKRGEKLSSVAYKMASRKYGCAVVENREGKVIGIFTTTDALFLLSKMLTNFDFDWQHSPQYMI